MRIFTLAILLVALVSTAVSQGIAKTRVVIEGAKQVSLEAIEAAMGLKGEENPSSERLAQARQAVERMGFFREVRIERKQTETGVDIVIHVEEWPIVEKIEVVGNKAVSNKDVLDTLEIDTGRIFNSLQILLKAKAIRDLYVKKGFFGELASVDFKKDEPGVLVVELVEMTVNSIVPYGNKRTRTDIIERLLFTKPGMPYNQSRWESDIRRLSATNWFESVSSMSGISGLGKIDLVPVVTEAKTGEWTAGMATEPGSPVLGTFSISERNYRGTGQSISFTGSQGLQTQGPNLGVDYRNPFFEKNNIALAVSLYTRSSFRFAGSGLSNGEDPSGSEPFSERRVGGLIGLSKNLDSNTSAQVGVRIEDVKANDLNTAPDAGITRQSGSLASLILGFTRNRRDTDLDPARGDWLKLGVEPGFSRITRVGGSLTGASGIGDHTFVKTTAEYRTYWSPDPRREIDELDRPSRVFALRVRYGSIYGDAPFSEQFFVGGTDSVRGHAQDRYWGNQMFISTLEYRQPLGRDMAVIGFVDYGGAWGGYGGLNDFSQSKRVNLQLGYGLGLSYRMPKVGPLRLDFGFDTKGRIRTHFQIATPF